jgi:D-aminopeptidase
LTERHEGQSARSFDIEPGLFSTAEGVRRTSERRRSATHVPNLVNTTVSPPCQTATESTEEAISDTFFLVETMPGRDGRTDESLPFDEAQRILRAHGRSA